MNHWRYYYLTSSLIVNSNLFLYPSLSLLSCSVTWSRLKAVVVIVVVIIIINIIIIIIIIITTTVQRICCRRILHSRSSRCWVEPSVIGATYLCYISFMISFRNWHEIMKYDCNDMHLEQLFTVLIHPLTTLKCVTLLLIESEKDKIVIKTDLGRPKTLLLVG